MGKRWSTKTISGELFLSWAVTLIIAGFCLDIMCQRLSTAHGIFLQLFPRALSLFFFFEKKKKERGKTSWTCLQSGAPMVIGAQGWTGSFFFFLCRGKKKEERWEMICKRLERLITIRIQENASRKVVN